MNPNTLVPALAAHRRRRVGALPGLLRAGGTRWCGRGGHRRRRPAVRAPVRRLGGPADRRLPRPVDRAVVLVGPAVRGRCSRRSASHAARLACGRRLRLPRRRAAAAVGRPPPDGSTQDAEGPRGRGLAARSARGGRAVPTWTEPDLDEGRRPGDGDRALLLASLRPRGLDFFTEPLPGAGRLARRTLRRVAYVGRVRAGGAAGARPGLAGREPRPGPLRPLVAVPRG